VPSLLERLFAEVSDADPTNCPDFDKEVEKGEKVLGVLSENLKRLSFVLSHHRAATAAECQKTHSLMEKVTLSRKKPSQKDMGILQEHVLDHVVSDAIAELFWASVKEEFPEAVLCQHGIGIRKGWKIVSLKPDESGDMHVLGIHIRG